MYEILDAPSVPTREEHDISFQSSFSGIARCWLGTRGRRGLVIGADPGRKTLVWDFSCKVAIDGSHQLVVEV